eukprot:766254-Hanusia_phi.AAC.5
MLGGKVDADGMRGASSGMDNMLMIRLAAVVLLLAACTDAFLPTPSSVLLRSSLSRNFVKSQRAVAPQAFTSLRCVGSETSAKKEPSMMISKLESSLEELKSLYSSISSDIDMKESELKQLRESKVEASLLG